MKIIGFNFTKFNVEKSTSDFKEVKISSGVDISEIETVKNTLTKDKEEFIGVKFKFTVDYSKKAGIELEGNVLVSLEPKAAKDLMKQWKSKNLPDDFRLPIFNVILRKANIKALEFEDEMNLPPHISMPSIKRQ